MLLAHVPQLDLSTIKNLSNTVESEVARNLGFGEDAQIREAYHSVPHRRTQGAGVIYPSSDIRSTLRGPLPSLYHASREGTRVRR